MIAIRVTIAVGVLTLTLFGCASTTETQAIPRDAADKWHNRQLFDTPSAAIYASNTVAAREVATLIREMTKRFTADTRAKPKRGLVIVTDSEDELVVSDQELLFTLGWRRALIVAAKPVPSPLKLKRAWNVIGAWSLKMNIPTDDMLRHLPLPLDEPTLKDRLQLPAKVAESAAWIVSVPTTSSLRHAAKRMLPAFLEAAGIGPIARAVLAPFHSFIEATGVAEYAKLREAVIYAEFVATQPTWSPEEKSRYVNAYLKARKIKLFDRKKRKTKTRTTTTTKRKHAGPPP